jgi:hypothetical protein
MTPSKVLTLRCLNRPEVYTTVSHTLTVINKRRSDQKIIRGIDKSNMYIGTFETPQLRISEPHVLNHMPLNELLYLSSIFVHLALPTVSPTEPSPFYYVTS